METVGIIGGAGFIGSYVTKLFLEENYYVKVSATDPTKVEKYHHLHELGNQENLQVVGCDVRDGAALQSFVQGCDIIVHTITPFRPEEHDPQTEWVDPNGKATENFLQLVAQTPGIRKVVFIASAEAWNTSFPMVPAIYPPDHVFSEQDDPYMSEQDGPYAQAKYFADQAVRKFISEHPHLPFEITSISPVLVIGNSLSDRIDSTTMNLQYFIKNKIAPNPRLERLFATDARFALIDVRDVAESVFQVAVKDGLHGKNYLISSESYTISDMSLMLNNQAPIADPAIVYNSALAKKELGLAFISARETLNHCG